MKNLSKREIFVKAWELARKGQRQFGGKVKQYFAMSLRIIYSNLKKEKIEIIKKENFNSREVYIFIQNTNNPNFNIERDFGIADVTIKKNGIVYFGYEKDMITLLDEEIEEPVEETEKYLNNLINLDINIFDYKFN